MIASGNSTLEFCLLGLIGSQPKSGYDLRKILSETPMQRFSDSPGAIYPALRRLEAKRWAVAKRDTKSRRRRSVFAVTPLGQRHFQQWLQTPLSDNLVANHIEEVMLRLAFLNLVPDAKAMSSFLYELYRLSSLRAKRLDDYFKLGPPMPPNARLAVEYGRQHFQHLARWAYTAARASRFRRSVRRDRKRD